MNKIPSLAWLVVSSLVAAQAVHAQSALELSIDGGSYPGPLQISVASGPIGQFAVVVLSATTGPVPLSLLDPRDTRVLDVGIESIGQAITGQFFVGNRFTPPAIPVPNDPGFLDATIHWQAFSLPGQTLFVDKLSFPRVTRFAPANAFRDRAVNLAIPRAFSTALRFPQGSTGEDRWIVVGGGQGGLLAQIATNTTEIYDPRTDGYQPGPTLTTERSLHTATVVGGTKAFLIGGVDRINDPQNTAELLDLATMTTAAIAPMRDPRMGHSATLLGNGKILVAGGLSDLNQPVTPFDPINSALTSTELYDPATNTWTVGPNMNTPRAGHAAIPLPDGRVLLAGGIGWIRVIIKLPAVFTDCDIYDPATNAITRGPSMGTARTIYPVADLGNGRFLVSGGISSIQLPNNLGTPTAQAEIYDASTNRWTATGAMQHARGLHAATPLGGGRFLMVGGADGAITTPNALGTTEVFDAAAGSFTAGPPMSLTRAAFAPIVSVTGQLHLLGGGTGAGASVVGSTDCYYR